MSGDERLNPDELLTALKHHEAAERRGRLKIFFGAVAGVGKTYSMLEAARATRATGVDLVIGYVEPHGRLETERLVDGLEQLPPLEVEYRGITRREFDLDAALARHPTILVVDELAHSNVADGLPKQRHAKRWQDIEEILAAGINVWTTLNVQHLESLNDVVASITGIRQRETIPDRIFDQAEDVELIDLPPSDLLARLHAGKVYSVAHATAATRRYFREPNLLALRELALRRTADRVDAAARAYDRERSSRPWLARDRFLIAVDLDDQAEQLVRVGKRFADALDAEWLVVSVETPAMLKLGEASRNRRVDILRLAESLGAQTVTLDGPSASAALCEYAQLRNITRIVVGEPRRFGLRALFRPSTATKLVRAGGGFDLSVIARRGPSSPGKPARCRGRGAPPIQLGALLGRHRNHSRLHRGCRRHVPLFRVDQHRHGVSAGRHDCRLAARSGSRERRGGGEHPGVRLLLCPAALLLRGVGFRICGHLRRHVGGGVDHRDAGGERPGSNQSGRCPRAPYRVAICDEPRARGDPQPRGPGACRRETCGGDLRQPCGGAGSRCGRSFAASEKRSHGGLVIGLGSVDRAMGLR